MRRLQRWIGVLSQRHGGVHLEVGDIRFSLHRYCCRLIRRRRNQRPDRRAQDHDRLLRVVRRSYQHRRPAGRRRRGRARRLGRWGGWRRALSARLARLRSARRRWRRSRSGRVRLDSRSDLRRGFRRGGLLRFDGGLDGEVLRLLTHQDRGSRHREDNAKDDRGRDPEQGFRLGDIGARRDRAPDLRIRSGCQAGAVEPGRYSQRLGRLHRFVVTGRNNRRRAGRLRVVGLVRPDRPARV